MLRYDGLTGTPGSLDTTFGSGLGYVITSFNFAYVFSLAMQPSDGKIVAVGSNPMGSPGDFAVARYTTGGVLDTSFNSTGTNPGTVLTDFGGGTDSSAAVAIQSDGKIVVSGAFDAGTGGPYDFAVARYWPVSFSAPSVPGMSTWGMAALAAILGAFVFYGQRRRAVGVAR